MSDYRALGIKNPKVNTPLPQARFSEASLGIQEHNADRAGLHYDLRIAMPQTGIAHSWAIPQARLPQPGEKVLAVESGDHDISYMSFQGTLGKGYGKGKVNLVSLDKIEVLESDPDKLTFVQYTGTGANRYSLIRFGGQNWLLLNTTATRETRPEIPQSKRSYPEVKLDNLNFEDPNVVIAPKVDGAHVTIGLRPDRRVDVFSYRPSKKSVALIDHSFKTDLYKTKSPKELGTTVLRAELFAVDPKTKQPLESFETGGILNSGTYRSREIQSQKGKLDHLVFDIDTYKGKDVSHLPYSEKFELLKKVKEQVPELKIIEPAIGSVNKRNLVDSILEGKNPLSREGAVVYNLNESTPAKLKIKKDIDVYFSKPFEPLQGSRLEAMGAAGGFYASRQPGGPANIRVGTGLNDEIRREIMKHPERFKNRPAKIYIQDEFKSGLVRAPVFKEWRDYEMWKTSGAKNTLNYTIRDFLKVKDLRSKNLIQTEVAKTLNLSQPAVSRLENISNIHESNLHNLGLYKRFFRDSKKGMTQAEIATKYNTTQDRVSKALGYFKKFQESYINKKAESSHKPAILKTKSQDPRITTIRNYLNSKATVSLATINNPGKATTTPIYTQPKKIDVTKKASIIDPVQSKLDPLLWDENLNLKPDMRRRILQTIFDVLGHDTKYVVAVKLLGAQTTYQYKLGGDIDVNVGFAPDPEHPDFINQYADLFKKTNPHTIPGTNSVINLFATVDNGIPQKEAPENVLALYDIFEDSWIKKPDPKGVDVRWLVDYDKPYIDIYEIALKRGYNDLQKAVKNQASKSEIFNKAEYLTELYKKLDRNRKISYEYGFGVPNTGESNVVYKSITHGLPESENIELIYKALKPTLLKGWLNI